MDDKGLAIIGDLLGGLSERVCNRGPVRHPLSVVILSQPLRGGRLIGESGDMNRAKNHLLATGAR